MKLEVISIMHVQPGDVYVGHVDLTAPTRPVQPSATGMVVRRVETETVEGERYPWYRLVWGDEPWNHAAPRPLTEQVMVIR